MSNRLSMCFEALVLPSERLLRNITVTVSGQHVILRNCQIIRQIHTKIFHLIYIGLL